MARFRTYEGEWLDDEPEQYPGEAEFNARFMSGPRPLLMGEFAPVGTIEDVPPDIATDITSRTINGEPVGEIPINVQLPAQRRRAERMGVDPEYPYGSGSPPPRDREVLGPGDDLSTRRLTPAELVAFDPGFQAIATGGDTGAPYVRHSPTGTRSYETREEYAQAERPPSIADERAQRVFGKAWAALTPEEQQRVMPMPGRGPGRAVAFERAGRVMREGRPMTEYQRESLRLRQEALDARRAKDEGTAAKRTGFGGPRPADADTTAKLTDAARQHFGDEIPATWKTRIEAVAKTPRKKRQAAIIAFTKDLDRVSAASLKSGPGATEAKRNQQVEDFNAANEETGLRVKVPGRYTDLINKRGSAKVEADIGTINRAMHASARLQQIDREYSEIPVQDRLSERALALANEYDYLRDEHQGIILRIAGAGAGDKETRQEIKHGLPNIRTTPSHFSAARLEGLHRMLKLNAEAMLLNYGIEIADESKFFGGGRHGGARRAPKKPEAKAPARTDEMDAFDAAVGL